MHVYRRHGKKSKNIFSSCNAKRGLCVRVIEIVIHKVHPNKHQNVMFFC